MSSTPKSKRKPRVVCLGKPKFIGDDYLEEFRKDFDYDASQIPLGTRLQN